MEAGRTTELIRLRTGGETGGEVEHSEYIDREQTQLICSSSVTIKGLSGKRKWREPKVGFLKFKA